MAKINSPGIRDVKKKKKRIDIFHLGNIKALKGLKREDINIFNVLKKVFKKGK